MAKQTAEPPHDARNVPWPPNANWLQTVLKERESQLVDVKREWYDLSGGMGKATFVKDVLAIANSLRPSESGAIVFGVAEELKRLVAIGVANAPDEEQVSQILATYTSPVPQTRLGVLREKGKSISVLRIEWTDQHPYWSTRDADSILSSEKLYLRRGPTVGAGKGPEMEALIRQKDSRLGTTICSDPLAVGFIQDGSWAANSRVMARVACLSDEPVEAIGVVFDVTLPAVPGVFQRIRRFAGRTLNPGESLEIEFELKPGQFYGSGDGGYVKLPMSGSIVEMADVLLVVTYRDKAGFIQRLESRLSLG